MAAKEQPAQEQGAAVWRREIVAGLTTFFTMAYIVVVNPSILSQAGIPFEDVFFATCVSAALATIVMGAYARYPYALAPGMGLNAFFAFTLCGTMGVSWQTGLSAVLIAGVVFLLMSFVGLREKFIAAVPAPLVRAIAAGIGLFITFIGLEHAGIVVDHPETLVTLGDLTSASSVVAVLGLMVTAALVAARVPGGILIGIAATAIAAVIAGIAQPPEDFIQVPKLPTQSLGVALWSFANLAKPELWLAVFTLLFLDLFDTMGTLVALGYATGNIDEQGRMPGASRAFTADATGTIVGALLGTSTVTSYIESAAGVVAGGRTGRTAFVVAAMFVLTLPLFPLIAAIPAIATAPALIVVGALMFSGAADIDWKDPVIAIPALTTVIVMPATYNISNGLGAGFILFVVTHLAARRFSKIGWATYAIAAAFAVFFAIGLTA